MRSLALSWFKQAVVALKKKKIISYIRVILYTRPIWNSICITSVVSFKLFSFRATHYICYLHCEGNLEIDEVVIICIALDVFNYSERNNLFPLQIKNKICIKFFFMQSNLHLSKAIYNCERIYVVQADEG